MLYKLDLSNILILDIETVPESPSYDLLDAEMKELWAAKTEWKRQDGTTPHDFYERAGIWAEFGKIVCISIGYFVIKSNERQFRVKSFAGDEKEILMDFKKLVEDYFSKPRSRLCAHNGKEFDFPYISRRMLINGIRLPYALEFFGKKPWQVPHIDTLELWKFGDYKHYTSLRLLTKVLGVPSPKDDMDGSMVASVYYEEDGLQRIAAYCEQDVIAVAQVLLRLRGEALLQAPEIYHSDR